MGWADALQGAGAWLQGNGPQYMAAQNQSRAIDKEQEKIRREAMLEEMAMGEALIRGGQPEKALALFNSRVESGEKLPPIAGLGGSMDTSRNIRDLLASGKNDEALAQLSSGNQILREAGLMKSSAKEAAPKLIQTNSGYATYDQENNRLSPVDMGGMQLPSGAESPTAAQKGSTDIVMVGGKPHLSGSVFNPSTAQWSNQLIPLTAPDGSGSAIEIPDGSGLPPSMRPDQKAREAASSAAGAEAIARSAEYFNQVDSARSSINGIDEAIAAIDDGASTGTLQQYLPTFRQSTKRLEAAGRRMGLDVVSAVTFGALSQGEMDLAMANALPKDMAAPDLREWLVERRNAQIKLANYLQDAAIYLGDIDNDGRPRTTASWAKLQKEKAAENEKAAQQSPEPTPQSSGGFKVISVQ